MNRILRIASLAIIACSIALGCSGGSQNVSKSPEAPTKRPIGTGSELRVALLTPGPVSDAGWSAMAYDGLTAIQMELGATVNNQEATGTKIRDAMRSYAQDGYQLVIGHGFEYNAPGVELAGQFPNTVFVSSSGGETAPNAGAFRFELEQGFYLAGMLAARMSKSGKLAMIGGPDVPSIRSTFKAFSAGAKAVEPGIELKEVFTGKDSDIAAAKQATLATIDQGADFVIHQTNAAAQGVFDACKERNVWAFGTNANQNANGSGIVIASAVIIAKPAFVELAKQVRDGKYKGAIVQFGMKDDAIDFVINPTLAGKVPAEVVRQIEATRKQIKDGTLVVPMDKF